jgi:MYXO-CTERM domain-containing protein
MRTILKTSVMVAGLSMAHLMAQAPDPYGERDRDAATTTTRDAGNWGWIGLLGLAGLFGLRRREYRTPETHYRTETGPSRA